MSMPGNEKQVQNNSAKDKKDNITRQIENNPCQKCRTAKSVKCNCGPGEGGDKIDGFINGANETNNNKYFQPPKPLPEIVADDLTKMFVNGYDISLARHLTMSNNKRFDLEKLAELLSITYDQVKGLLTLQPNGSRTKEELELLREFLHAVEAGFNTFKNELKDELQQQGIAINNLSASNNVDENKLTIHIPPQYLAKFIDHLTKAALWSNAFNVENIENTEQARQVVRPQLR